MDIYEVNNFVTDRLVAKKKELQERQEQFDVMWHNEKDTGCFERNAINDLLAMQQLKIEIKELERLQMQMRF